VQSTFRTFKIKSWTLQNEAPRSLEAKPLFGSLQEWFSISSGVLMGYSWALLYASGLALGVFRVSLEVLFGSVSSSGEGFEAKTSKCLKTITF